jgi:16S rRNA (cytidine1402-2'-O)-methyltransferase
MGNLGDISARAIEALREADVVCAEDTRHTRGLLSHLGIGGKELIAIHAHSTEGDLDRVGARLDAGAKVALVTDAGTPTVSDPGEALVRLAIARGVRVSPVPGPSALVCALSASGLSGGRFRFFGFLPRDGTARDEAVGEIAETREACIVYEAANRLAGTLADLARATPRRPACVARELTKVHEEMVRGDLETLAKDERAWRGEVVLVLGPHDPAARERDIDDAAIDRRIDEELRAGHHAKTVAERIAAWSGRRRRDVYERVIARKAGR